MKYPDIEEIYQIFNENPKICTDTRKIENNAIFFALKGESFNGNKFAKQAIDEGCSYAIIDEEQYYSQKNCILVANVMLTLQKLALYHRKRFNIPVLGITGTNGKTTTKELISAVILKKYNTIATIGNLNNHIGVPLTLLRINNSTEFAIIEMGANHVGEISELCNIAQPNYGVITNIGKAHLEGFKSYDNIIKTKKSLYDSVANNNGLIFVNDGVEILPKISNGYKQISYGQNSNYPYSFQVFSESFLLKLIWKESSTNNYSITTNLVGSYNADNVYTAITIGKYFGVDNESIINAVQNYKPSNHRSQLIEKSSNTIIMDAYNANPSSMKEALISFNKVKDKNKVLILGDMLELGSSSMEEHKNIVEFISKNNFKKVILIGSNFKQIAINIDIKTFINVSEAKDFLQDNPIKESIVLIKGSRGIKLEQLLDVL